MMEINAINSSPSMLREVGFSKSAATALAPESSSFGSAITNAIESLDKQQLGAEMEIARTVAGESPDLHRTIAALQTADLSFQFALQVRNKVISAYEDIMRMQV
jgi:flagellar hook-basal body complex protein FliE